MEKLRELRKQNKLSMKELGAILGLSESTISLYENGKREPDIATIIKIANYFNISVDELLGIKKHNTTNIFNNDDRLNSGISCSPVLINFERMCSLLDEKTLDHIHTILYSLRRIQKNPDIYIKDKQYLFARIAEIIEKIELYVDNYQSALKNVESFNLTEYNKIFINGEIEVIKEIINTINPQNEQSNKRKIVIPFYKTPASAGIGSWLADEIPVEWVTISRNDKTIVADFMLEVRGDSMQPKFFDGDRVLVKQSDSIYENEIGVFILNNESYIKKMGKGELISLNPAYEPIKLTEYDDIRCAGKVIDSIVLE